MTVDWSEFVYRCDPGVGQQVTTLHPVLSAVFLLETPNYSGIRELYDGFVQQSANGLTHYQAENMKRPAPLDRRAMTMVPAWLTKPKDLHRYWWIANGGTDLGCSPPEFLLSLFTFSAPPAPPGAEEEMKAKTATFYRKRFGIGDTRTHQFTSEIRLAWPVDHVLSEGGAVVDWLQSLDLIKSGTFASVQLSYGLSSMPALGGETRMRERALCSRYPGLDCFQGGQVQGMFRVDPSHWDVIPLIKRAAWTNVLHERTVTYLGGEAKIRAQLADTPEIRVVSLEHGLIIQAGPHPQLGDLNRGDDLPLVRKVAKVLRPARVQRLVDEGNEFWQHFFTMHDKEHK